MVSPLSADFHHTLVLVCSQAATIPKKHHPPQRHFVKCRVVHSLASAARHNSLKMIDDLLARRSHQNLLGNITCGADRSRRFDQDWMAQAYERLVSVPREGLRSNHMVCHGLAIAELVRNAAKRAFHRRRDSFELPHATLLAIACKQKFLLDGYEDEAVVLPSQSLPSRPGGCRAPGPLFRSQGELEFCECDYRSAVRSSRLTEAQCGQPRISQKVPLFNSRCPSSRATGTDKGVPRPSLPQSGHDPPRPNANHAVEVPRKVERLLV